MCLPRPIHSGETDGLNWRETVFSYQRHVFAYVCTELWACNVAAQDVEVADACAVVEDGMRVDRGISCASLH